MRTGVCGRAECCIQLPSPVASRQMLEYSLLKGIGISAAVGEDHCSKWKFDRNRQRDAGSEGVCMVVEEWKTIAWGIPRK